LEREARAQDEETLERKVRRLADFLVHNGEHLDDDEYEDLLAQHDEARALLDSFAEEAARKERQASARRRADLDRRYPRYNTTRKSMTTAGERYMLCHDCGGWLDRDADTSRNGRTVFPAANPLAAPVVIHFR
jgi:hypothetical protein